VMKMRLSSSLYFGCLATPLPLGECGVGDGAYLGDCVLQGLHALAWASGLMLLLILVCAALLFRRSRHAAGLVGLMGFALASALPGLRWVEATLASLRAPLC
jgi:hypothetical protein